MTAKDNYSLRRSELVKTEADFLESSQLRICTRSLDARGEREKNCSLHAQMGWDWQRLCRD